MDSFYDQPRKAPMQRTPLINADKILPAHVPDASMLQQNKGNVFHQRAQMSYNAWKVHQKNQPQNLANKENLKENGPKSSCLRPMQPSLYRKQVRFESPTAVLRQQKPNLQFESAQSTMPISNKNIESAQKQSDFLCRQKQNDFISSTQKQSDILSRQKQSDDVLFRQKQDDRISDVLCRQKQNDFISSTQKQSDLLSRQKQSDDVLFRQKQNDHILSSQKQIGNVLCPPKQNNNILQSKPFEKIYMANIPNRCLDLSIIEPPKMKPAKILHYAESTQIEPKQTINDPPKQQINDPPKQTSDDPSVKDLLKIIQQQNEQLVTLQKQVSTLLQERNEIVCLNEQSRGYKNAFLNEKRDEVLKNAFLSKKSGEEVFKNRLLDINGATNKFAIDVMTSFEVSIRPPNNFVNRKFGKDGIAGTEPKITEIIEDDTHVVEGKKNTDVSLTLNEPLVVREECQSPENSIHIDMQDFSSSDEDETSNHSSLIGWTIYNNVMDQVNFLIKKSQGDECKSKPNKFGTATMQKVKEATLKHLKNVGVNLPNMDDTDLTPKNDSGLQYSPTEVSFAVKQLLMKYLPNEHLAKISETKSNPERLEGKYPTNLIKRRPDFSMATVQYMEKYNLLKKSGPKRDGKLLDITALKQQPKLL